MAITKYPLHYTQMSIVTSIKLKAICVVPADRKLAGRKNLFCGLLAEVWFQHLNILTVAVRDPPMNKVKRIFLQIPDGFVQIEITVFRSSQ